MSHSMSKCPDCEAKDARIVELKAQLRHMHTFDGQHRARIAELEAKLADMKAAADEEFNNCSREEARAERAEARVAEFADKGTLQALRDANDRMERAEAELNEWEQCARYDAMMEGPRFKGWDRSQMERCRKSMEARRAALAPSPVEEKT